MQHSYDFDLVLARPAGFDPEMFLDAVEGMLFEEFEGDVTPGVIAGVPYLACTVEADTMEAGLNALVARVVALGLTPERAEIPQLAGE